MKLGQGRWQLVLGLTGGLGSGKSTVLQMLRRKGLLTLDADRIVQKVLLRDQAVIRKIGRRFGSVVGRLNHIDRKKLADIVFKDSTKRARLEKILHPLVKTEMNRELMKRRGQAAVCDVPLLWEKGWAPLFDKIICVYAKDSVRRRRLLRKGFSAEDVRARFKAQWPQVRKVKKSDFLIDNSRSLRHTRHQVDALWNAIAPSLRDK